MIILIALTVIFIIGIGVSRYYEYETVGIIISVVSGTALAVLLLIIPLNRVENISFIQGYEAIKETRNNCKNELENAALTMKIMGVNAEIAKLKYWNDSIWDIWISDEVEKLEPLK